MTKTHLLGLFVLAFALRLVWVVTLDSSLPWIDEREFASVARHLAAGDGFVSTSYRANPVLPAYLALVFHLFGENVLIARLGQAVMGAVTCLLIATIGGRLFGPTVGLASGVLLALYPPHVYLSGVFYVECLFTLLITLTVALALRTTDAERVAPWALLTGVSFGIAALTRSIFCAYLPFLLAALAYVEWPDRSRALVACAMLLLGVVLTITPWSIRNHAVFGRTVLVSSGLGTKLWQGNNEMAAGDADDRELYWATPIWDERARRLDDASRRALEARYAEIGARVDALEARLGDRYLASDQVLMPIAAQYMREHPARTVTLFAKKLVTLFTPFTKTITDNQYTRALYRFVAGASTLPVLILAPVGVWLGIGSGRRLAILYALLGSIVAAYGILNTCARFRLPLDPFIIVLAALALVRTWESWIAKKTPAVLPALTLTKA